MARDAEDCTAVVRDQPVVVGATSQIVLNVNEEVVFMVPTVPRFEVERLWNSRSVEVVCEDEVRAMSRAALCVYWGQVVPMEVVVFRLRAMPSSSLCHVRVRAAHCYRSLQNYSVFVSDRYLNRTHLMSQVICHIPFWSTVVRALNISCILY